MRIAAPLSILGLTLLALAIAGCVTTSVYPYYFEKDVAFESALLGGWVKDPAATDLWKIERHGGNGYRITYTDSQKSQSVLAHAFTLRGQLFLDLFSGEAKDEGLFPAVPSHLLVRVSRTKPSLRMTALNYAWLEECLSKNPKILPHLVVRDSGNKRLVLTANTRQLQKFVIAHLKTTEAWEEELELQPNTTGATSE